MSKTIYTVIFGNYDTLKEPLIVTPGWRYVCYTDQHLTSKVWEVIPRRVSNLGPVKSARCIKLIGYNDIQDDDTIWIDASFQINCDLNKWWEDRFVGPMTLMSHPIRDCFYDEVEACLLGRRASSKDIKHQLSEYSKVSVPRRNGMIASGLIMRRRDPVVYHFCQKWWSEVVQYSSRDQLAYSKTAWLFPIKYNISAWDYRASTDFIYNKHAVKVKFD